MKLGSKIWGQIDKLIHTSKSVKFFIRRIVSNISKVMSKTDYLNKDKLKISDEFIHTTSFCLFSHRCRLKIFELFGFTQLDNVAEIQFCKYFPFFRQGCIQLNFSEKVRDKIVYFDTAIYGYKICTCQRLLYIYI